MIPLGELIIDQPNYTGPGLKEAKNVLPREDGTYGPLAGLTNASDALPARCYGIMSTRDASGTVLTIAGTATNLYKFESDASWTSIGSGYTLDGIERWRFTSYQNSLVAAGGIGENVQVYDLAAGGAAGDLAASAPQAVHPAMIRNFLMLGNIFESDNGAQPTGVSWSAIGDITNWPTRGTSAAAQVQSSRRYLEDGGWIQGIVAGVGGADGVVFGETRIWRVTYEGPPYVFRFDPVTKSRGVYVPGSIIAVNKIAYFRAEDGFYAFDGANLVPIGAGKVDQYWAEDFDDSQKDHVWTAVDATRKHIYWAYPGAGNNGYPNRMMIYNYVTGMWSRGELDIQALGSLMSIGYTLESLDSLGYTMETLPYSLDSRFWAGGGSFVGVVNSSNILTQFEGDALQADLTTTDIATDGRAGRIFINGVRAYVDASDVTVALKHRSSLEGTPTTTPYRGHSAAEQSPHRVADRFVQIAIRVPASSSWTRAQGYDWFGRREGTR